MRLLLAPTFSVLALSALTHASCKDPTYVTLKIDTDVKCGELQGTSISIGRLSDLETRLPLTTVSECQPDGTIGSLVVTPSGGETDEWAVRVVSGVGRNVDECKAPAYGEGCIVARRALKFVENTPLTLPISMRAACSGRACSPTQTCVKGLCVDALVKDSSACSGAGCGEDVLASVTPGGRDGGAVVGCDGLTLDYAPSNIDPGALKFPKTSVVSITSASCTIDGEAGKIDCLGFTPIVPYEYTRVATPEGDVAVFTMCDLRVQPAAVLEAAGNLPIVLVALGKAEILGSFSVAANARARAGGAVSTNATKAGGSGGGEYIASSSGGGGGGYCGRGGSGGQFGAPGSPGGSPYGNAELVPLRGGSAGGARFAGNSAGGGAMQIVAGGSVTVGAAGRLHAGGGGGYSDSSGGGGGGSGGAILIEAPTVTIAGTLAANGGGGGSNGEGRPGEPSDMPAAGAGAGTDRAGGQGSAGVGIDGAGGVRLAGAGSSGGGGGGGGAGRIRINSRVPATITGVVSPALTSPCATQGPLR